jgi:hypothetical protein
VTRHTLEGVIASAGFASGDRVVVGSWAVSPVGPFTDLMWAEPDGTRVLVVSDQRVAAFVTAVYRFDRVEVVPVHARRWRRGGIGLRVEAGERRVALAAGVGVPFVVRRPAAVTRWVEGPVARRLLAVETFGRSPTGVHEWYQAARWRPLRSASARVGDRDLGALRPVWPPVRVGFSEPPRRPSFVEVRTLLEDPTGALDRVLRADRSG